MRREVDQIKVLKRLREMEVERVQMEEREKNQLAARLLFVKRDTAARVLQRALRYYVAFVKVKLLKRAVAFERRRLHAIRQIQRAFRHHLVRKRHPGRHNLIRHRALYSTKMGSAIAGRRALMFNGAAILVQGWWAGRMHRKRMATRIQAGWRMRATKLAVRVASPPWRCVLIAQAGRGRCRDLAGTAVAVAVAACVGVGVRMWAR